MALERKLSFTILLQIFLINACRGAQHNVTTKVCHFCLGSLVTDGLGDQVTSHTDDCFVWFSTEKDHVSYRSPQGGSIFIQKVAQVNSSFVNAVTDRITPFSLYYLVCLCSTKVELAFCQELAQSLSPPKKRFEVKT